ncbi:sialin-like [Diabrotica undecimpunctata]|uniref:sialin-like n=1 Tax=Diabrotica undecimpunctata TaxID=50387 RepID=UPI003B63E31A
MLKIWYLKRYIVAILAFFGFMNIYSLRSNLSIAIVDMTSLKNVSLQNGTNVLEREFEWNSTLQGYVLSSFFYGYIFTQIIGGFLAAKLGGARVFGLGIASTSLLTLVTPWIAKTSVYFLIAIRILEGALEGVTYPAMQEIWSHWAPPSEKSRLVSIAGSGSYFGAVVAMPICSLLATYFGWESIFYTFGVIGFIWYAIWLVVVADTPSTDKYIKEKEVKYINEAISSIKSDEKISTPWCTILKSRAVWASSVCLYCETWGFYTLLTFLPQMMKSLLGFDLNQAGFLSALPYLAMSIMVQVGGFLADYILGKKYITTTQTRKLGIIVGFTFQSLFILIAGYWISKFGTPFCLVTAVGLGGLALSSLLINPLDIAPKFAGVIFGINNSFATIPGIVSPILTGYIVTDQTSVAQWRIVFYIASATYLFGAIFSFLFTDGQQQSWADITVPHNNKLESAIGYENHTIEVDCSEYANKTSQIE